MTLPIFWDGYGLENLHSGVGVYAKSLASELGKLSVKPTLVGTKSVAFNFPELPSLTFSSGLLGPILTSKPIWPLRTSHRIAKEWTKPSILHGLSNFNVPIFGQRPGQKLVLTVHDIIPLLAPDKVSKALHLQMQFLMRRAVEKADRIICVSQWTFDTLFARFPQEKAKGTVIRNGAPPVDYEPRSSLDQGVQMLMVGRFEPYKRVDLAIEILRRLPDKTHLSLVTNDEGQRFAQENAQDLLTKKKLTVITQARHDELVKLYKGAHLLLHPSEFEGFCLPAAEAMAAGCPVLYRSGTALDEIVGSGMGLGMKPGSKLDDWVQAARLVGDFSMQNDWQERLSRHFLAFPTWKEAAASAKALYNELS